LFSLLGRVNIVAVHDNGGGAAAVVTVLRDRIRKAMTAPDQVQRYAKRGLDIIASTPGQFAAHLASEPGRWASVVKQGRMRAA
jgi:tripartite-type tricarboxylate transporter receptor subunit TctC